MTSLALGVLAGCSVVVWWGTLPGWQWLPLLLPLILPGVRRSYLLGLVLGGLVAGATVAERLAGGISDEVAMPVSVNGEIIGLVADAGELRRFDFRVTDASLCRGSGECRIRVSWRDPPATPRAGEAWRLPLRFHDSHGPVFPGGFDAERWRFREGLDATASVATEEPAVRIAMGAAPLSRWRQQLAERLSGALEEPATAALVRGITVGDRHGFSAEQWDVLNGTGTTHLVAISGLHVGMVAGLVYWLGGYLLRLLPTPWPAIQGAAVLALAAALAYAAMAGFAIPTRRALIMFAVLMLLLLLRRRTGLFEGIALALIAVLLSDPLAVLDAGLFLSFGLVLALLVAVAGGERPGPLAGFLRVQWVAGVAVLPLLALAFQQAPLVSPLANLVAVPVFMFVAVPAALAGTATIETWPAVGSGLLQTAGRALEMLWPVLELASRVPEPPIAAVGMPVAMAAMVGALAVVVPGPALMRWALGLAVLPLVFGSQSDPRPQVEAYALNEQDRVFRVIPAERQREFLLIRADGATVAREIRGWLSDDAPRGRERVVVIDGPGRRWKSGAAALAGLDGIARTYVPRSEGLPGTRIRHCREGVGSAGWRFVAPGAGFDPEPACRIEIRLRGGGRLVSDGGERLGLYLADDQDRVWPFRLAGRVQAHWEMSPQGPRRLAGGAVQGWWRQSPQAEESALSAVE